MVRKDAWNDFYFFEFTKASFMAQDVIYPGEGSMCIKLDLEKTEEPEIKLSISIGSSKKQESSRETSISALFTITKPLTVWITTNCGKF